VGCSGLKQQRFLAHVHTCCQLLLMVDMCHVHLAHMPRGSIAVRLSLVEPQHCNPHADEEVHLAACMHVHAQPEVSLAYIYSPAAPPICCIFQQHM